MISVVFFWLCVDCKHPKTAEELLRVTPSKVPISFVFFDFVLFDWQEVWEECQDFVDLVVGVSELR